MTTRSNAGVTSSAATVSTQPASEHRHGRRTERPRPAGSRRAPQPQRDVRGLDRLAHDAAQVGAERLEVELVAQPPPNASSVRVAS